MRTCIIFLSACIAAFGNAEADRAAKDALDTFKKAFASKEESERAAAVTPLGEVAHPSVVHALAGLLVTDGDTVRIAAAGALGKFVGRRDVAPVLAGALDANKGHEKVEGAIIVALGGTNDPAAVAALKSVIDKEGSKRDAADKEDAKAAVEAIGKIKWKASVDVLIQLLRRSTSSPMSGKHQGKTRTSPIAKDAEAALKALVGAQGCTKAADWQKWWNENQGLYDDQLNSLKK